MLAGPAAIAMVETRLVLGPAHRSMQILTDTWIVFSVELRRALRSPRVLVVLLLYLAFSAGVMLAAGFLAHQAQAQLAAQGQSAEALMSPKAGLLAFLFGQDRALLESLLALPAVLLVVFKLGLMFLPAYVALLGFDSVASELQTRSLRYFTVRTSRTAIALGKGLALAVVVLLLVTVVHLGAFTYAVATQADFSLADAARSWPRLWGTTALVGLGMAALTTLCSTASRNPAIALTLNFAALLAFWAAGTVGSGARMFRMLQQEATVSWQERIGLLAPSTWSAEMLYPDAGRALLGALVLLCFAVVCTAGAVGVLRARDV
jgi:ABC-2 type transport system permease protein